MRRYLAVFLIAVLLPLAPPAPSATASSGAVNGYPCGGRLPPCWVLRRESHGNPRAYNPRGCGGRSCGGLWQFDPVTFLGCRTVSSFYAGTCPPLHGYRYAHQAPVALQNRRAREVWRGGAGCHAWDAC